MKTQQDVVKALMAMASLHGKDLSEDAADMLLDDLAAYEPEMILRSLKICRMEINRFPNVSEIIKRLNPQSEKSQTEEIVGRIYAAIGLYGYPNPEGARKHIGEEGWHGVQLFGGWMRVCDFPPDKDMALRSQLKHSVESVIDDKTRALVSGQPHRFNDVTKPIDGLRALNFNMDDFGDKEKP